MTLKPPPRRSITSRKRTAFILVISAGLSGGCQSYAPKPLDLPGHLAAFLDRTPDSPQVEAFATRLTSSTSPSSAPFSLLDGATCAEAESVALVFNADLRLARLRAGVMQASADNAGRWEDPTLGVDLTRIVQGTPHPWKVFSSIGLTLPLSGRLEIEKQRAGFEHAVELARVAQREWDIRIELRRAWIDWSSLDIQLTTSRAFSTLVDQVLSVVDAMEQAGEMARTESRLFRIEKATRLAESAALQSRLDQSLLRIKHLMGLSPDANLELTSNGFADMLASSEPPLDPAQLETRNPSMTVARTEYDVAEKTLELEIRKQYPDLHIGPGYGREDGQDQVLLGLSIPLPLLNGNRQAIATAIAAREASKAAAEVALEKLISDTRSASARLKAAQTQREAFEQQIVPLVDAQYADVRSIAQLGEVNTLVLLESLSRQHEAKTRLIEARRDEILSRIELQNLTGPPLPSVQHSPSPIP